MTALNAGALTGQQVLSTMHGTDAAALAAAFDHCRAITKKRARNFYYGLRLTPEPRRSAIYAIYAWMRDGDDRVDSASSVEGAVRALDQFAAETDAVLAGAPMPTPAQGTDGASVAAAALYWPAFRYTVALHRIERPILQSMIDGLREDLTHSGYASDADLEQYCYRVASTAGLSCIRIWGLRSGVVTAAADTKAIARGKAFQLTNILRDVAEDFDSAPSRVYLPADAFARHRLTPESLRAWSDQGACVGLLHEYIAKAEHFYEQSAGLEDMVDPACAPSLWGMTRIYRGLLDVIAANPSRVITGPRVRLSSASKAAIALRAFIRAKSGHWTEANPRTGVESPTLSASAGHNPSASAPGGSSEAHP